LQGNVLVVGFDPEFADRKELADRPRNIEVLRAKLKEKLRMDVSLKFQATEAGTAPASPKASATVPAKPATAGHSAAASKATEPAKKNLDDFKNDPLIKKALEIFKGTIVDVRK
jgi:hypothetical protein